MVCRLPDQGKKAFERINDSWHVPFYFQLAEDEKMNASLTNSRNNLSKQVELLPRLIQSGQQWDAPNGWAPMQWITIIALENYQHHQL